MKQRPRRVEQQATKNRLFLNLLRLVSLGLFLYSFFWFGELSNSLAHTNPIEYELIKKERERRRRGFVSSLLVKYNQEEYKVNITRSQYFGIDENKNPDLYYSKRLNYVFTEWWRDVCLKLSMIALGFLIFFCIPYVSHKMIYPND